MSTKMKGLLKGLRYISQIFDEEKEPEMQIGFPTDVKHVAHIGWDGPSVDSPSWMKEFKAPGQFQSAPLAGPGEPQEGPEIKWVSEDSKSSSRNASSSAKDSPGAPRSSRRHSSDNPDSPKKEVSTKRGSRRLKDSSDSVRSSNRQIQDQGVGSESNSGSIPDIPKKSRRKKSKETLSGGSTRPSRSKGTSSNACTSQVSDDSLNGGSTRAQRSKGSNSDICTDAGPEMGPIGSSGKDELSQLPSTKLPNIAEEEKGS